MIAAAVVIHLLTIVGTPSTDPWADEVIGASPDLDASGLYNDPASVLGSPATTYYDDFAGEQFDVALIAAAFNLDAPDGQRIITTLAEGAFVIVRFDEPVRDDPRNPFGIDLLVFGNAFFTSAGGIAPDTDMNAVILTGGLVAEPVTVAVSSTGIGTPSSDPGEWHVYTAGPFADTMHPTQARAWDAMNAAWGPLQDFTRPVHPGLGLADFAGLTAAEAIAVYDGSGGGTGIDLAMSGFAAVQYVHLSGSGGEVDALADVFAALGDGDRDGDVDLADAAWLQRCAGRSPRGSECFFADANGDEVIDAVDHAAFSAFLEQSGPLP